MVNNSQVFTAWKICQFRNHSDFKSLFPIFFVFFDRWLMYVHNLLKPVDSFHQQQRWSKRAPDLAWFNWYSLFGPIRFSSSVYILAGLYLSNFSTAALSLEAKGWAVFDWTAEYGEKSQGLCNNRVYALQIFFSNKMTLLVYFSLKLPVKRWIST